MSFTDSLISYLSTIQSVKYCIMFLRSKNLGNCCRTCLNSTDSMHDIFSYRLDLSDIISSCTNIKVEYNDALPKNICSSCYNCLISFYDFRLQAEKIDQNLRNNSIAEPLENKLYPLTIKSESEDLRHDFDDAFDIKSKIDFESERITVLNGTSESELCQIKQEITYKYYCEMCKRSFQKQDEFEVHKKKHAKKISKSQRVECDICSETFLSLDSLSTHMLSHAENDSMKTERILSIRKNDIECDICSLRFKSMKSMAAHKKVHFKKGRVHSCSMCKKVFKKTSHLMRHELIHNKQSVDSVDSLSYINSENEVIKIENIPVKQIVDVQCDVCSAKFQSANSLAAHKRVHIDKDRILSCATCQKIFKKTSHLKRHELTHDVNRQFKCSLCPKSFATEAMLKEHSNVHSGLNLYTCMLCSKSFATIDSLKTHTRTHTKKRVYMCATCGKTFNSSSNLNQHIKRHMGLKTFSCTLCPQSFVSKGELNSHTVTHTGVRAHACEQCGVTFTKRSSLNKHARGHLNIRPYPCETCSMRFTCKDHLKRHTRIHTGEKPYHCGLCDRTFTQSADLLKHRRAHLGDKLYKCDECSESFRLKTELRQHMSEHFVSTRLQALNTDIATDNIIPPGDVTITTDNVTTERNSVVQKVIVDSEVLNKLVVHLTPNADQNTSVGNLENS